MYKSTSNMSHSFFGNFVYDRVVPSNHPLRLLKSVASFEELDEELAHLYKNQKGGQKAFKPSLIVRILILQHLYNLSDDKIMNLVRFALPAKLYVGLAVDQDVPHATTLTYFRNRLGDEYVKTIFQKTVRLAVNSGLELGEVLLIDATHSNAKIRREVNESVKTTDTHKDPDARGGCKGNTNNPSNQSLKYTRDKKGTRKKPFYGYKHHWIIENNHNIITAVETTPGNKHDSIGFVPLLEKTEEVIGLHQFDIIGADKAYDDKNLHFHELLTENNIASAISLRKTRLQTRNKETKLLDYSNWPDSEAVNPYYEMYLSSEHQKGQEERYKVEQSFAEGKRWHGLGKSRYLGLAKNRIQSYLTATALNLKHIIKGLTPQPIHLYKTLY